MPVLIQRASLLSALCCSVLVLACNDTSGPPAAVAEVALLAPASFMGPDSTMQLTVTTKDAAGRELRGRTVTWTSSNPSIASVSGGLVTAVRPGVVTITATSEGIQATTVITIQIPVAAVTVTPVNTSLSPGGSLQLTATALDETGNTLVGRPLAWVSSNPAIASVSAGGIVTTHRDGVVLITATIEGKTATSVITVAAISSVTIAPAGSTLAPGTTMQLTAMPRSSSGALLSGRAVDWTSSNPAVATVSVFGLVTAVSEGNVTITAVSEGHAGTTLVTVEVPVATVTLTSTVTSIGTGSRTVLQATASDAAGNILLGRDVTWLTSNAAVATVVNGTVTGVGLGTATITAVVRGKSASLVITVIVPVASVTVSPSLTSIDSGTTITLNADVRDINGNRLTNRPVTWTSSNAAVATVSTLGVVTGVRLGSVTITATVENSSGAAVITVEIAVATVTLTSTVTSIGLGSTTVLQVTARDAGGNILVGRSVTWLTSNAGIATVSNGTVTAMGFGNATITAVVGGKSASLVITVVAPVEWVAVRPSLTSIDPGTTIALIADVRDINGNLLTNRPVTWTTSNAAVATVSTQGVVTGVSQGSVTITATAENRSGTADIAVGYVAAVTLTPGTSRIVVLGITDLTAVARDNGGNPLPGRPVAWSSSNTAVATVNDTGLVTGVATGTATITATSGSYSASAVVTVELIGLVSVRAGGVHTCGLTANGTAYCWGSDANGQMGNETTVGCLFTYYDYYYWTEPCNPAPTTVSGGLTFTSLATGGYHTCGLVSSGAAYCWGANYSGQLGSGASLDEISTTPSAVVGGLFFKALSASRGHTCGISTSGVMYCWGSNGSGQLGDGSLANRSTPGAVTGTLTFTSVSTGDEHTCGITASGPTYCWGSNVSGQLGLGTSGGRSATPALVVGGHAFATIGSGYSHTCATTTANVAYCWGANGNGQAGNGGSGFSTTPSAVAGGHSFKSITAGSSHTCALNTSNAAYCWGYGGTGQLGNGSYNSVFTPVAVGGSQSFASLSAGSSHSCGVTTASVAYCWGYNEYAQLGIGSREWRNLPARVVGQQ